MTQDFYKQILIDRGIDVAIPFDVTGNGEDGVAHVNFGYAVRTAIVIN